MDSAAKLAQKPRIFDQPSSYPDVIKSTGLMIQKKVERRDVGPDVGYEKNAAESAGSSSSRRTSSNT